MDFARLVLIVYEHMVETNKYSQEEINDLTFNFDKWITPIYNHTNRILLSYLGKNCIIAENCFTRIIRATDTSIRKNFYYATRWNH